jgi:Flp pilus assembly protein CpaB
MFKYFRSSRAFFAAATLLAVLGSFMLYGYLHGLELRVARDGNLLRLPVARVPIAAGSVIDEEMLQVVDFPDLYVLPTMLLSADEAVGMVALHDIAAGDPFLQTSVSAHGQGGRAALLLDPLRRAYPLDLQENQVPLEDLRAGDRVDLIYVPPEGRASVIIYAVSVLCLPAGDQVPAEELPGGIPSFETTTSGHLLLSLTPDETETLAEAEEQGRIVLAVCPAISH